MPPRRAASGVSPVRIFSATSVSTAARTSSSRSARRGHARVRFRNRLDWRERTRDFPSRARDFAIASAMRFPLLGGLTELSLPPPLRQLVVRARRMFSDASRIRREPPIPETMQGRKDRPAHGERGHRLCSSGGRRQGRAVAGGHALSMSRSGALNETRPLGHMGRARSLPYYRQCRFFPSNVNKRGGPPIGGRPLSEKLLSLPWAAQVLVTHTSARCAARCYSSRASGAATSSPSVAFVVSTSAPGSACPARAGRGTSLFIDVQLTSPSTARRGANSASGRDVRPSADGVP